MNNKRDKKMKILRVTMALAISSVLSGCQQEPPKCSDEKTIGLVKQILAEQFAQMGGISQNEVKDNLTIKFPRASSYQDKIKKYSCDANLNAAGTYEVPIRYESQLDDDNHHVVAVDNMSGEVLFNIYLAIKTRKEGSDPSQPPQTSQGGELPGITGVWKGRLGGFGEMDIRKDASTGYDVSLSVSAGACNGLIEGTGKLTDNVLTVLPDNDDLKEKELEAEHCQVTVRFIGDTAQIEEKNCLKWHGAACGFDGTLHKVQ